METVEQAATRRRGSPTENDLKLRSLFDRLGFKPIEYQKVVANRHINVYLPTLKLGFDLLIDDPSPEYEAKWRSRDMDLFKRHGVRIMRVRINDLYTDPERLLSRLRSGLGRNLPAFPPTPPEQTSLPLDEEDPL